MLDEKRENAFHIMVDHKKLEEHRFTDGNVYVWMPLFHEKVGYGVEFVEEIKSLGKVETVSQKWPVCPYTVMVENRTDKANFAALFVDGQKVAQKFVAPHGHTTFEGIPTENGIQELLFSLPRYATLNEKDIGGRALPECLTNDLGTVKVVWRNCVKAGQGFNPNYKEYGTTTSFTQGNKYDARASGTAHVTGGQDKPFASTTRLGKVVRLNEARSCTVTNHTYVGEPWTARICYRTKEYLQGMNVIPQDTLSEEELAMRRARLDVRRKRSRKQAGAYRGGASGSQPIAVEDGPPEVPSNEGMNACSKRGRSSSS